jgi:hypothetical protein
MADIFSEEGSLLFKKFIANATNLAQNLTTTAELNKIRNLILEKLDAWKILVDSPTLSPHQKETARIYLEKMQEVLNLINARINEIDRVGGKRRKRRKRRTRKSRTRKSRTRKSRYY